MPDDLLDRFRRHDRQALSRLLTLAARGLAGSDVAQLGEPAKPARVIALTGAGGVGKSTLAGKLIDHFRKQDRTVAVLACDPQSPLSGGALLGDRFRMPSQPDDGVFIRSLVANSGRGPLAEHLGPMVKLLEAFPFDIVLIETAGAGQGDTAVRDLVDGVVLLLQPEAGDDLQWEKAGVIEVADVIAVNKADLTRAAQVAAQVQAALDLAGQRPVPVVLVSAKTGQGIEELGHAIDALALRRHPATRGDAREFLRLLQERLMERFAALGEDPALRRIIGDWQAGELGHQQAVAAALRILAGCSEPEA